jgi:hypothetical protein
LRVECSWRLCFLPFGFVDVSFYSMVVKLWNFMLVVKFELWFLVDGLTCVVFFYIWIIMSIQNCL